MTAQPLQSRPTVAMRARVLSAGTTAESLVLAVAVPFLFLHATYQPHVSLGVASTSVDVTLADAAVAAVVAAAARRARREGFGPMRAARWVLGTAAVFVVLALLALATPAVLDEDYGLVRHAISALKLGWYALLLPATVLLVRSAADAVPLFRALVLWSGVATTVGLLQFLGVVSEFEGKRPGQREPSLLGIHDFAALSGAALTLGLVGLALADGRPLGSPRSLVAGGRRAWTMGALVTGALGMILSGALTAVAGLWLALGAILLITRGGGLRARRRALAAVAIALAVAVGTATMRAGAIERFAEFLGIRDRVEDTGVESYAHRTLLAYVGLRIWLGHPIAGVGWQASSEQWAYGPYLDDARARFPDEPDQAFPSPEHPWGVQTLYLQILADMGVIGFAALVSLFAAAGAAALGGCGVGRRKSPGERHARDRPQDLVRERSPDGAPLSSRPRPLSAVPLTGLAWLLVAAGIWAGIGLVPGVPLAALTFLALGLTTVRG